MEDSGSFALLVADVNFVLAMSDASASSVPVSSLTLALVMVIDVPILFHALSIDLALDPLLVLVLVLVILVGELAANEASRRLASSLCIGNGSLSDILMEEMQGKQSCGILYCIEW
jgi:xanthosine utilization system XapX-like protein